MLGGWWAMNLMSHFNWVLVPSISNLIRVVYFDVFLACDATQIKCALSCTVLFPVSAAAFIAPNRCVDEWRCRLPVRRSPSSVPVNTGGNSMEEMYPRSWKTVPRQERSYLWGCVSQCLMEKGANYSGQLWSSLGQITVTLLSMAALF